MSNKISEQYREGWTEYRTRMVNRLAKESGLDDGPVKNLFVKGLARAIDEKFAKAEEKEKAVDDQPKLTLQELSSSQGIRGEKDSLIARLETVGLDDAESYRKLSVDQLRKLVSALG